MKNNKIKNFLSNRKKSKWFVIGAIIVAFIVVVVLLIISLNQNQAKSLFAESDIVKNGPIPTNYVDNSNWDISQFNVTNSNEKDGEKNYDFTSILENEFFYVDLNGNISKRGNDDPDIRITLNFSKPKKGVTRFDRNSSNNENNVSLSNLKSDFNEDNGRYTSSLSGDLIYESWFAVDSFTQTQNYTFDMYKGWVEDGSANKTNSKTEWKILGKTFQNDKSYESDKDNNHTICIKNIDNNVVSFDYSFHFGQNAVRKYNNGTFDSADSEAVGTLEHELGTDSFMIKYKNGEKQISINIESYNKNTLKKGDYDLSVQFKTNLQTSTNIIKIKGASEYNFTADCMFNLDK